jgi:hypothetical protein
MEVLKLLAQHMTRRDVGLRLDERLDDQAHADRASLGDDLGEQRVDALIQSCIGVAFALERFTQARGPAV